MDNKEWKEKVLCEPKNGYDRMPESERAAMNAYCESYKAFLDAGKTERECVVEGIRQAEAQGFKPYVRGMELKPGDKIYQNNRGKMLLLAVIGSEGLDKGCLLYTSPGGGQRDRHGRPRPDPEHGGDGAA